MTVKWMKEHGAKIVVGAIVIVILLMFALPSAGEQKSATCVGESCPRGAPKDDTPTVASGLTSGPKSMKSRAASAMASIKGKLRV